MKFSKSQNEHVKTIVYAMTHEVVFARKH